MTDAWVRLPAVAGRPAAAYFTLHAGAVDTTLTGVTTDAAIRTELHETRAAANGRGMTMAALRSVAVPANGSVGFVPGGRHVMLFDIDPRVRAGGTITLALTFSDGRRIQQQARVIGAGDPPPAH